jgi:hypothetical protein
MKRRDGDNGSGAFSLISSNQKAAAMAWAEQELSLP